VGALTQEQAELVTVSPLQRCVTFWERVVMPQIWFLLALRYQPAAVNRARQERDVIANGHFILTARRAYEAAGTHAAVRHEVAEDLGLAKNIYLGGRRSFPGQPVLQGLVPLMLIVAMTYWLIPVIVLATGGLVPGLGEIASAAPTAVILSATFWMLICHGMRIPIIYGLAYPVGALMALYIILRSTWPGGRRVEWKGRIYGDRA